MLPRHSSQGINLTPEMQQDCRERLSLRPAERWRAPTSRAVQNGEDLEASGEVDDVECIELQPVRVVDGLHVATDHRVERVGAVRSHCRVESAWSLGDDHFSTDMRTPSFPTPRLVQFVLYIYMNESTSIGHMV